MASPQPRSTQPLSVTDRTDASCRFVRAVYPAGGVFGPYVHSGYLLVVLVEGQLELQVGREVRLVMAGEATLTRPGLEGTYRFSPDRVTVHTACHLGPEAFSRAERQTLDDLTGVFPVPASVQTLIGLGLAVPTGARLFASSAESIGRACLLHYAGECLQGAASPHFHPAVIRALDLLRGEPAGIRDVVTLAKRSGVSPSRLRQLFRNGGHPSPAQALWAARTEHALRLLRHTGLTLAEIAAQSGFADPFHLSRVIKRATGKPPRALRAGRSRP